MHEKNGFVVSSARKFERNASSEVYYALTEQLGYESVVVSPVRKISGLSLAFFSSDSVSTLKRLSELAESDPSLFQYTLKIVPFQFELPSTLEKFQSVGSVLSPLISSEQKWKIVLRRRHTQLSRKDVISSIATQINHGTVDLEKPEVFVLVEIIGQWSYVGLSPVPELSLAKYGQEQEEDFSF